jgi:uncharacterized membrane protein
VNAQDLINQQEWERPENWTGWLGTYRSERDERTWVPKRNPVMGWTLNFAHRNAWWWLLGPLIVPLGLLLFAVLARFTR